MYEANTFLELHYTQLFSNLVNHCILYHGIMTHHSYNDEGICFSKETNLGTVMERKMQVETLGGLIYKLYLGPHL